MLHCVSLTVIHTVHDAFPVNYFRKIGCCSCCYVN